MNMVQKRHRVLWAKPHLKWTVSKWKSVLWSDEFKFEILVGNHGRRAYGLKKRETFQRFSSKASIFDGMGVHKGTRYGQLACFMNTERYIKVFEQHMLPSRGRVVQQDNANHILQLLHSMAS